MGIYQISQKNMDFHNSVETLKISTCEFIFLIKKF